MEKYELYPPAPVCAECKGKCCKHMGCHYSPQDFEEISFKYLKAKILKGNISIDWWEERSDNGPEISYFLRARHVGAPVVDPSFGGVCVNLTPIGCALSFEDRPTGGKTLRPDPQLKRCVNSYGKKECKDEWKQYNAILIELANYFC